MIAGILSLMKIILIDLVMSGDNAIIIAFATQSLPKHLRKKATYIGIAGAAILRIILASVAVYLLQYPYLKYAGGLLLLYVARGFFRSLKLGDEVQKVSAKTTLRGAIGVIIIADFSLSLDNVLAVASVAENIWILAAGLVVSIAMMVFASSYIAKLMDKHHWIQRGGLVIIIHAALDILMTSDIQQSFLHIPITVRGVLLMLGGITYLYIKNVVHVAFHLRKHHLHNHVRLGIVIVTLVIVLLSDFFPSIHAFVYQHLRERLTLLVITYMVLLELVMQQRSIDKHYMKHESRH